MENENKTINKGIMWGWTAISTVLFLAYVVEAVKGNRTVPYFVVFSLLLLVPLVSAWFYYRKKPENDKIKHLCSTFYGILYVFVLLTGATPMVFVYVLPMIYLLMLCNDESLLFRIAFANIGINIVSIIVQITVDHREPELYLMEWEIQIAAALLCSVFSYMACRISSKLYAQRMRVTQQSEERLQNVLGKVTEVAAVVENDTKQMLDKLVGLETAAGKTAGAMEEIVTGSAQSTEMVERQLHMTSDIQAIIDHTNELTGHISERVDHTSEKVHTGIRDMRKLSGSAKEVEENSRQVLEHMNLLRETTEQVQDIVQIISGIAGQTNLLALNASIEAARAGDAGRGFAVVAEEINGLANQTKESTQNIAQMVGTLRAKAEEAARAVQKMAELNEQQNGIIFDTEANFDTIRSAVEEVKRDTDEEKEQMEKLLSANAQIVESIQTISAVSEEVMANTTQTQEVTEENKRAVDEVTGLAQELGDRVVELKSYT